MKYLLSLIAASSLFFACKKEQQNESITPIETTIVESVYASGKVKPYFSYQVYAQRPGILLKINKTEGQTIKANELLAQIDDQNQAFQKEISKAELQQLELNTSNFSPLLLEIKANIDLAQARLYNDSINYSRYKRLFDQKATSEAKLQQYELAFQTSKKNLQALQKKYLNTKVQLETSFEQSALRNQISESELQSMQVRSLINGTVYALFKKEGEYINPQEPLAVIGDSANFLLELNVDEMDIAKLTKNLEVLIEFDSERGEVYKGYVHKIYPYLEERSQSFKLDVILESHPKNMFPGMSAEANIVIEQKEKALCVPSSYLLEGDSVLTEQGKIAVKIGLQNLEQVEIISGLDQDTKIIKP